MKLFSSKSKKNDPEKALKDSRQKSPPLKKAKAIKRNEVRNRSGIGQFARALTHKHYIYGSMIVIGAILATVALQVIIKGFLEDAAARSEYEQLRVYSPANPTPASPDNSSVTDSNGREEDEENEEDEEEEEEDEAEVEYNEMRVLSFDELAALNRDFVGWIYIRDHIDYPVVRGSDNSKYINTTFLGRRNTAGTIFMDYRNVNNFEEQVSILYGHNTRDGAMFSSLSNYLNPDFFNRNPNITVTTRDGKALTYKIFAAELTDAWDIAYTIGVTGGARASEVFPNVPENASRFLLLSTCTRSSDDDERILIYAAMT